MLGARQSRAEAGGTEYSPLASQLQQAWLQSQIHSQSTKLQKRGLATQVTDVSIEKRASYPQLHPVASDRSSIVADHNGVRGVVNYEELYFHKSRLETPEFLKRPDTPQLVSYSRKADLPQRSISGSISDVSTLSSLSSPRSGSLSPSSNFTPRVGRQQAAFDAALDVADYADSGALDLAGQSEPLVRFLDGELTDEDLEEQMSQEGFNCKAMAKELEALVSPEALELGSSEFTDEDYDISWTTTRFSLPTEEDVTDRLIHAYTNNLNKHVTDVTDVTENVDASTWINEQDACTDHSDESWDYYLECIRAKPESRSSSSSLLQDHFFGKDASLDPFAFSTGCVDLKALLLRYSTFLSFLSGQVVYSTSDLKRHALECSALSTRRSLSLGIVPFIFILPSLCCNHYFQS